MLVQFTVGNFLSFNGQRTISLKAKGIAELKENVSSFAPEKLLRSMVIYGANSSGKSNLIKALERMRDVVMNSVRLNDADELDYTPFLLSTETEGKPTFFEIIFWKDGSRYRYGFQYSLTQIETEWLFAGKSDKSEQALFIRTQEGIGVDKKFKEGAGMESKTNDNRLFVSLVAQLGGNISKKILDFFSNYNAVSGIVHKAYIGFTLRMLHKQSAGFKESMELFERLQLGFQKIEVHELDINNTEINANNEALKQKLIKELTNKTALVLGTVHTRFNKKGQKVGSVNFDARNMESDGTNKIIDLSGPIFDTLLNGKLLVIDELDAKLHPLITMSIVELFNSSESNPNNAQLIFATHDTNLLSVDLFRRDQIWFTEKDELEQTDLYALNDINLPDGSKVRNDSNLEKNYIRGRYGAIPFITN